MGIIDYVGYVAVAPVLGADELELLQRLRRPRHRGTAEPAGRSPWVPCADGCCLSARGKGSSGSGAAWMRHLIRHYLYDHALAGKVVGCSRDDRSLFVLTVSRNRVQSRVLWTAPLAQAYAVSSARSRPVAPERENVIYLHTRRRET